MDSNPYAPKLHITILKCSLKWGLSLGIVAYLVAKTNASQLAAALIDRNFDIARLAVGVLLCSFSVFLTLFRWQQLLTAFRMPVRFADVIRIGLFSYALNLFALGNAGGDLGRAILIGKQNPGHQKAAVLSVALDRIIGLYAMFLIVAVLIFTEKLFASPDYAVQFIVALTLSMVTLLPGGAMALLKWSHIAQTSNVVHRNSSVSKCLELISACKGQSCDVGKALLISLTLRVTTAIGIYFLGTSLTANSPDFRVHFLAISLAMLTGCLPLPFNGLGALESTLEFAFHVFPETPCTPGYGVSVAILYRIFLLGVGILGTVIFCYDRKQPKVVSSNPFAVEQLDCQGGNSPPPLVLLQIEQPQVFSPQ